MIRIRDVLEVEINNGKKKNIFNTLVSLYMTPSKSAIFFYRISKLFYDRGYKRLAVLMKNNLIKKYGLHISLNAQIDIGLELRHVNGVVIGDGVVIGRNAIIYQQVTLGGKNLGDGKKGNYPIIGDNVTVFAGAKILGNVRVGNNSIIGANSVVINDVEDYSVYAGVPAKKIKVLH